MTLQVTVTPVEAQVCVVTVSGEVDMHTSPELRKALAPLFTKKLRGIVVDLSAVQYIDSSGIATLIEGLKLSYQQGSRFFLTGLSPFVQDVLSIAHLEKVFDIVPQLTTALEQLQL